MQSNTITKPLPDTFYQIPLNTSPIKITAQFLPEVVTQTFTYQSDNSNLPLLVGAPLPFDLRKAYLEEQKITVAQYIKNNFPTDVTKDVFGNAEAPAVDFNAEMRTSVVMVPKDDKGKGQYQMVVKNEMGSNFKQVSDDLAVRAALPTCPTRIGPCFFK